MNHYWVNFDDGSTIDTVGAEQGIIIEDLEYTNGARISLEKNSSVAPFAITLGVYGMLFYTDFYSTCQEANAAIESFKTKTEILLNHYDIPEAQREVNWREILNSLLDAFTK